MYSCPQSRKLMRLFSEILKTYTKEGRHSYSKLSDNNLIFLTLFWVVYSGVFPCWPFKFDPQTITSPASVSAAVKNTPHLIIYKFVEVDWINWATSFTTFPTWGWKISSLSFSPSSYTSSGSILSISWEFYNPSGISGLPPHFKSVPSSNKPREKLYPIFI